MDNFIAVFTAMSAQVIDYLPRLLIAVSLLAVGWLCAWLLRALVNRLIRGVDRLWNRLVLKSGLEQLQPRQPPARIASELLFWLVILFFVVLAADYLGLVLFVSWLEQIITYLPVLLASLLIILVGFVLSSLARDMVSAAAASAGIGHHDLIGRLTQLLILATAIIIGIELIGIDISFLTMLSAIIMGTVLGALALAFGLGARHHVENIIAAQQMHQFFEAGDRIKLGELEGDIVALTSTNLIVDTEQGRSIIPAKLLAEQISTVSSPLRKK